MAGTVRVGMSGFSYASWRGAFYPADVRPAGMLSYYATRFAAVEINATFRRMPTRDAILRWRDAVPPEFRFALKAPWAIAYRKEPETARGLIEEFVSTVRIMGDCLGPLLFQPPARARFDAPRLSAFLSTFPEGPTYAIDARDDSFRSAGAEELLRGRGAILCLDDDVVDPSAHRLTGPAAYFRFRRGDYKRDDLLARRDVVRAIARQGADVYVFFRHRDRPSDVRPALEFLELLD